jgi:ribosome-binding factor A
VGDRLDTRYTPRITFVLDKGIKNAEAVARILNEVLPREQASEEDLDEVDSDEQQWEESPENRE